MKRVVRHLLAALLLAMPVLAVSATPASAAEAYGATISGSANLPRWPCQEGCTTTGVGLCCATGISGGPDWNTSYIYFDNTTVSYQTVNCLIDNIYITVDSSPYPFGSNRGYASLSLQRYGNAITGSMYFTSATGQASGYYDVAGTVLFGLTLGHTSGNSEVACVGGPRRPLTMAFELSAVHVTV